MGPLVEIRDGHFTWDADLGEGNGAPGKELAGVNLRIMPGELVCVVGKVGSGKSSLLHALLGELHQSQGELSRRGRVALCGQEPWIQNATLRANILFYLPWDEERYNEVIQLAQLQADLHYRQSC